MNNKNKKNKILAQCAPEAWRGKEKGSYCAILTILHLIRVKQKCVPKVARNKYFRKAQKKKKRFLGDVVNYKEQTSHLLHVNVNSCFVDYFFVSTMLRGNKSQTNGKLDY